MTKATGVSGASENATRVVGATSTATAAAAAPRRDRPVRAHSLGDGFFASPDPFVTTWVGKIRSSTMEVLKQEATRSDRTVAYIIRELVEGWAEKVVAEREKARSAEKTKGRKRK